METSKQQFEIWISEQIGMPLEWVKGQRAVSIDKYYSEFIDIPYQGWKASRQCLTVNLPPVCDCHSDDTDKGYDICHYRVQDNLKSQGLNFQIEGADRWKE